MNCYFWRSSTLIACMPLMAPGAYVPTKKTADKASQSSRTRICVSTLSASIICAQATTEDPVRKNLEAQIFMWVSENPGVDSEDVANYFKIDDALANDIVEGLLRRGLLDFNQ